VGTVAAITCASTLSWTNKGGIVLEGGEDTQRALYHGGTEDTEKINQTAEDAGDAEVNKR